MQNSDPWDMGNDWSEPRDCSSLLAYENLQVLVQRREIQEKSGRFLKLRRQIYEFRENKKS